jgi:hypothetical protein
MGNRGHGRPGHQGHRAFSRGSSPAKRPPRRQIKKNKSAKAALENGRWKHEGGWSREGGREDERPSQEMPLNAARSTRC